MPTYECENETGSTWTWNTTDVFEIGAEVTSFHFTALASDGGHGDYSRLYYLDVWVR